MTKKLMVGASQKESFRLRGSVRLLEGRWEPGGGWGSTARFAQINEQYALEMRFEGVPDLCQRFGLTFPAL